MNDFAHLVELAGNVGKAIVLTVGTISSLCTAIAVALPKTSRIGYWLAKIGTDLKGHTTDTAEQ